MRIAIPVFAQQLAPDFSSADTFSVFDIHDETRAVSYQGRHTFPEIGCARTPVKLRELGVELIIGHHVSQNALNHLLEYGILAVHDAPLLSPDALIIHLVSGTLQATHPDPAVHRTSACGSGGCDHCTNHSHH